MEYVDIVDEQDNVVDTTTRVEANEKKLRIRAAKVLVFDNKENLIIQKRVDDKYDQPGSWDICVSETVQSGESYEQAAYRGLWEEYGVRGVKLEFLGKMSYDNDIRKRNYSLYKCVYDGELTIDLKEIAQIKWIGVDELREFMKDNHFSFSTTHVMEKIGWLKK